MGNDGVGQRVGRPRRSGVQGESPREEIVGAAARLFAAAGYAQTSVSAIAREAGLGQSSLYYWFANKEAILQALIDKNRESLETARELVDATGSPAHRLYRIVYVDVVQMCSAPLDFYELERVARAQPEAFYEFFSDYRELERLIAQVIRQGSLRGSSVTSTRRRRRRRLSRSARGSSTGSGRASGTFGGCASWHPVRVDDRRRPGAGPAARPKCPRGGGRVGLTESTHFQYSIEKLPSEGFDDTSKTRRRRTSPGGPHPSGSTAWTAAILRGF